MKNSDEDAVLSLLTADLCTIPSQKGLEPVMAPQPDSLASRRSTDGCWLPGSKLRRTASRILSSACEYTEDLVTDVRLPQTDAFSPPPRESDRARGFRKRALLADKKRFLRFDGYGASALTSFGSRGSRRSGRWTCRAVSERRRSRLVSTDLAVRTISPLLLTCRVKRPRMSVAEM